MDVVQNRCNGVIFTKIAHGIRDAKHSRGQVKHPPPLAQSFHYFLVGKQKIACKEAESINTEPINGDDRGIQYLCRAINNDRQHQDTPDRCFGTEVPDPVFFNFPNHKQKHGEQPEHLDVPQRSYTRQHSDQIQYGHRKARNVQSAANFQVIDTKKPLEHEQADRGRNQQLAGFIFHKLFCGMALQIVPCAHPRHNKQQCHEPRVDQILKAIL